MTDSLSDLERIVSSIERKRDGDRGREYATIHIPPEVQARIDRLTYDEKESLLAEIERQHDEIYAALGFSRQVSRR